MIEQFINQLSTTMESVQSKLQRDLTLRTRVGRRFNITDLATLFGKEKSYLTKQIMKFSEEDPAFPEGVREGRERTFDLDEIMLMRAILNSNSRKKDFLHWRKTGDPLKIVTFGAQKGGTGKSLSAAHFAQYISLQYGLRVGVVDMDPQATATLYFADSSIDLFAADTQTVAHFSGVDNPPLARELAAKGEIPPLPSPEQQNDMWRRTPWPGTRLIPGNSDIQNGDISLYFMAPVKNQAVYSSLKDAISTWEAAYPPKTLPEDLLGPDGKFYTRVYNEALTETLDVIVIDQQPSLTLMQLNGLMAATNVVIPQTMKGFDLSTLTSYARSISEYVEHLSEIVDEAQMAEYCPGPHVVLPTIVQEQNERDLDQLVDLRSRAPDLFLPVWYSRSDAISNAAEEYKSVYEYDPPRTRRASAKAFLKNANAVNDALVKLVWQGELPSRGYADEFIKERWS
ncbi:ParA family protein [Roseovarius sp. D0-M9]|uniref:ParA family protein n=1 Tax=Roseovarius sp. D0-M9 TaxID=3127117 RepID=UPI00300FEABE